MIGMQELCNRRWRTPVPQVVARAFAQRDHRNVWKWAEDEVVLNEMEAPGSPGPYRTTLTPHTRFFQEAFTDRRWREIVVKKGSQGAFTESWLNCIRWSVANQPANILYAIDSKEEMRRIFKTRLIESLKRVSSTRERLSEDDKDTGTLSIYLANMWILGCGGHTAGALANKPVKIGCIDEADKHPDDAGDEGSTIDLMRERFKTVADSKLIVMSKPVWDDGPVTREFLTGTQHRMFVPCPHCGHYQQLLQERIVYRHCKLADGDYDETRVLKEAFYECESCNKPITERERREIIPHLEWRQTNFKKLAPAKLSMEYTDLYSLFPQATLGHLAVDLIHAQRSQAKMKQVQANRFARGWKEFGSEIKRDDILALCSDYKRGTCPWMPDLLILSSDLQGDGPKWVLGAFRWPGELAIVDWGAGLGLDELKLVRQQEVPVVGSEERVRPVLGIIDEGFQQKIVYDFVLSQDGFFFPAKGRGGVQTASMRAIVSEKKSEHQGQRIIGYHFSDEDFKRELYLQRIGKNEKIKAGLVNVPRLMLPADVDTPIVAELSAERLVPKRQANGFTRWIWEKHGEANDYGDAVKLLLVPWHVLGPNFAPEQPQETEQG